MVCFTIFTHAILKREVFKKLLNLQVGVQDESTRWWTWKSKPKPGSLSKLKFQSHAQFYWDKNDVETGHNKEYPKTMVSGSRRERKNTTQMRPLCSGPYLPWSRCFLSLCRATIWLESYPSYRCWDKFNTMHFIVAEQNGKCFSFYHPVCFPGWRVDYPQSKCGNTALQSALKLWPIELTVEKNRKFDLVVADGGSVTPFLGNDAKSVCVHFEFSNCHSFSFRGEVILQNPFCTVLILLKMLLHYVWDLFETFANILCYLGSLFS